MPSWTNSGATKRPSRGQMCSLEPWLQRHVVGDAAHQRHRRVRVRVDEARESATCSGSATALARRVIARRRRAAATTATMRAAVDDQRVAGAARRRARPDTIQRASMRKINVCMSCMRHASRGASPRRAVHGRFRVTEDSRGVARRALEALPKTKPRTRRGSFERGGALARDRFALDFDFDAAVRREARDQFLQCSSGCRPHPEPAASCPCRAFRSVPRHALADEVIADRIGATLGQPLVVLLRADADRCDRSPARARASARSTACEMISLSIAALPSGFSTALSKSNSAFDASVIFCTCGGGRRRRRRGGRRGRRRRRRSGRRRRRRASARGPDRIARSPSAASSSRCASRGCRRGRALPL